MYIRLGVFTLLALSLLARPACAARNLLAGDSSFETGYGVWEEAGALDDTTAHEGQHSVRLTGSIVTWQEFELKAGKTYTFSVYLRAKEPGMQVRLAAARTDWSGDVSSAVVTVGTAWERYSLSITPKPDASETVWLRIDRAAQPDRPYWIDACQFEEGAMTAYQPAEPVSVACEVESPVPGPVFYPEEQVKLTFRLYNSRKQEAPVSLRYQVRDYYGTTAVSGEIPFRLPAQRPVSRQLALDALRVKGFYVVDYDFSDAGAISRGAASFCIVAHPLPYSPEEGSLFALSSISEGREQAAARIGVKWSEADFIWHWLEQEHGKLDAAELARAIAYADTLDRLGINVIGRVGRTPGWAAEPPVTGGERDLPNGERGLPKAEAVPAYEEFVYQVVSRLKGKIHYWLTWGGEDDIVSERYVRELGQSQDWVMRRIAEVTKAGYRGAKRADPNCVWGGGGEPCGVDCGEHYPYTRKMFALAGDSLDALCIHPYTWPSGFQSGVKVESPEEHGLDDILREALAIAGPKRCWISEYGFGLSPEESMDSPSADRMADYMARSYLLTASVPRLEMLQWFADWNCVEGGVSRDMWRWPNPLPVVATYSALAQVLTGARNPQELMLGRSIKAYAFEKKQGSMAALWVPSNREVPVRLESVAGLRVVDIMGNEVSPKAGALTLSGSPIYFLSDRPASALIKMLSETAVELKPVSAEIQIADTSTLRVQLVNEVSVPLSGTVAVTVPLQGKGEVKGQSSFTGLQPGAAQAVEVRLPGEMDVAQLKDYMAAGQVQTDRGVVKLAQAISLTACPKIDKPIVIDGDLADWEGMPFIEMKDASYLSPPDVLSAKLWTGEADLSVWACLAWDEQRFYFAARVRDGGRGNSIQIGFDPQNEALKMEPPGYNERDREFRFGYSKKLQGQAISRTWPAPAAAPQAELAVKRQGEYVSYELALPWAELGSLRPEAGKVFGFSFVVNNRDLGERADYCLALTPGIFRGKDPSAFRKFVLEGVK